MTATTQTPPGVDQLDRIALNLAHHLAHLSTVAESTRKSDLYQTIMRAIPEKERAKFFQKEAATSVPRPAATTSQSQYSLRLCALLAAWGARAASAHPSDAMLINKHIRELKEAYFDTTPAAKGAGGQAATLYWADRGARMGWWLGLPDGKTWAIVGPSISEESGGGPGRAVEVAIQMGWRGEITVRATATGAAGQEVGA